MKPDALSKSAIRESHLSAEYILYLDCKCPSMAMLMKPGNLFRKYMIFIVPTQPLKYPITITGLTRNSISNRKINVVDKSKR